MRIQLYTISKTGTLESIEVQYQRQCRQFGTEIMIQEIFNQDIHNAQKQSLQVAQHSYTKALRPFLTQATHKSANIALHPAGKLLDSFEFAQMLQNQSNMSFFIGGAFGFGEEFLSQTTPISLSPLTLGHKIARIVLIEQIYRALSIIYKHPYHK